MKNRQTLLHSAFPIAAVILAAALMLLCGCRGGQQEVTDAPSTTEAPAVRLTPDGSWSLVRPERASDELRGALGEIGAAISASGEGEPAAVDDWLAPGVQAPEHEILLGATAREQSRAALADISAGEYTVRVSRGSIVCVGKTDGLTVLAARHLAALISSGTGIYDNYCFVGKGDFPLAGLTVGGTPIDKFTIVLPAGIDLSAAAEKLSSEISTLCGVTLPTVKASAGRSEHEIVLGCARADTGSAEKPGYGDVRVYMKAGSLYLDCASRIAASTAVEFISAELHTLGGAAPAIDGTDGAPIYELSFPDRSVYINDPSKMPLMWENRWQPTDRLTSWDAKVASLMQTDKKRVFTVAHRADFGNYPENSIEAIISVWAMGGDCVEIDVRFTRDGVAVIMHDDTLDRMTDFSLLAGKDGLPTSNRVSDWTLDELRRLCLREGQGGNTPLTPYKIATLEEVLTVCRGRLFVTCDKPSEWRYCEISGIMTGSKPNYLFPIIKKTGNTESLLISYGTTGTAVNATLSATDALKIQKYIYDNTGGGKTYFFLRGWTTRSTAAPYARTLTDKSMTNAGVLINGAFDPSNSKVAADIQAICGAYPKALIGAWTIEDATDKRSTWEYMYGLGVRAVMTNNIEELVRFAAAK